MIIKTTTIDTNGTPYIIKRVDVEGLHHLQPDDDDDDDDDDSTI